MKVTVVNETKKVIALKNPSGLVGEICRHLFKQKVRNRAMLVKKKELVLVFLSSAQMKKINKQFRGKNKPTDILSFAGEDDACLGELLLCSDVLKKQAIKQGHSFQKEAEYMLIHGILHLLGYDHEISAKEEKLMFSIQERCFSFLQKP